MATQAHASPRRTLRVFISSTFEDMQGERDELAFRVFPELRARCRERGISLVDVDLRWGITEEQERLGEVLPVCLRQIEHSRPFFIGLLGERYGSIQTFTEGSLVEAHPWLRYHRNCSLLELEILHGALLNIVAARHAFFYFRAPSYVQSIPVDERARYLEVDSDRAARLRSLKQRIRDAGFPVVEDYADPVALADRVLEDLWSGIIRYLESSSPATDDEGDGPADDSPARDAGEDSVARSEERELDEKLKPGAGTCVIGLPGSGKTVLLTNWVRRFSQTHPEHVVFLHFVGDPLHGAEVGALQQRLLAWLRHDSTPKLVRLEWTGRWRSIIGQALERASERAPILLVIDGLDQLEQEDSVLPLDFLPSTLPPRVSVVCSLRPGRWMECLKQRGWETVEIGSLSPGQRDALISRYLERYGKQLSPGRRRRIAEHELAANPLFLRAVLEELRAGARHEELDERITELVSAAGPGDLFGLILKRLETRLEEACPGILKCAVTLLWASRRGLHEPELLDLLTAGGEPMARRQWSLVLLGLEESLTVQSGRIRFRHHYVRDAVATRYLQSAEGRLEAHKALIAYFRERELSLRKLEEMPWQLQATGELDKLRDFLVQPEVFQQMWMKQQRDLVMYWTSLGKTHDLAAAMRESLARFRNEKPGARTEADYVEIIGSFLSLAHRPNDAAEFFERARERLVSALGWDSHRVAECLSHLGYAQHHAGNHAAAAMSHRRALALLHKHHGTDHEAVAASLSGLAMALVEMNDLSARELFERAVDISTRVCGSDHPLTAMLLDNMAGSLISFEGGDAAEGFHREALAIAERTVGPDHIQTAKSLDNLAGRLIIMGKYEEAERLVRRSLQIWEREVGDAHPDTGIALSHLARAALGREDYVSAAEALRRRLKVFETGREERLTKELEILKLLANELTVSGQHREAELVLRDSLEAMERLGVTVDRAELNQLARSVYEQGVLDEAEQLFRRALATAESAKWSDAMARAHALMGLSKIMRDRGELQEAAGCLEEALALCREAPDATPFAESECLNLLSTVMLGRGELEIADTLSRQAVEILEEAEGEGTLAVATLYDLRSRVLLSKEDNEAAEEMSRRAVKILTGELGEEHPFTLTVLHNLSVVCASLGDLDEAEALLRRVAEARCRVLGDNHPSTGNTRWQLAEVLRMKGSHAEALELGDHVSKMETSSANRASKAEEYTAKAWSLSGLGRHDEAEQTYRLALEAFRKSEGPGSLGERECLVAIGKSLEARNELDGAEDAYREALALAEKRAGEEPANALLSPLEKLARVLARKSELEEVETLIRRALAILSSTENVAPAVVAMWQRELANALAGQAEYEEARAPYEQSLAIFRETLGEEHEQTVMTARLLELNRDRSLAGPGAQVSSLLDRGEAYLRLRNADGAERPLRHALAICEKSLADSDPLVGRALGALGAMHSLRGQYDEAEPSIRRSLEISREAFGEHAPNTVVSYSNLASVLASKEEHEEAVRLLRIVLDSQERDSKLTDERALGIVRDLAENLLQLGRDKEAAELLVRIVDANKGSLEKGESWALWLFWRLVPLFKKRFSETAAEAFFGRVLEIWPRGSGSWPLMGGYASFFLARLYSQSGRHSDAVSHYEGVLEAVELFLRPEHLDSDKRLPELPLVWAAVACRELALHRDAPAVRWDDALANQALRIKLLRRIGREADAQVAELDLQIMRGEAGRVVDLDRMRALLRKIEESGELGADTSVAINAMAVCLRGLGKLDDAEDLARKALALDEKLRGEKDPKIPHRLNNLSTILLMLGRLEEAVEHNTRAWRLMSGKKDIVTARILLIRAALAMLMGEEFGSYVGQLKTILAEGELTSEGNVAPQWKASEVINHLEQKLPRESAAFIAALVGVLNDRRKLAELEVWSVWHDQAPVPLGAE